MDIGAYAQIEDLEAVAEANGIYCPRLRGYRLMKDEPPIDIQKWSKGVEVFCLKELIEQHWDLKNGCYELSLTTDVNKEYYIGNWRSEDKEEYVRWDRIHGKHRKMLKTAIHNEKCGYKKQAKVFNKYAGREDVLYIHARIGGGNWPYYYKEVVNQPWFIEKVDDGFDSTYCDIYAKIGVANEVKQ